MTQRRHPSWCICECRRGFMHQSCMLKTTRDRHLLCHIFSLSIVVSSWQPWFHFDCWSKSARLSWKASGSCLLPQCWCALPFLCGCFWCLLACSSSGAPWSTGALLSDWQLAGELYDGDISPAVSHFPGSGSPDTQKRGRIRFLSHPFWIMFGVQKKSRRLPLNFYFLECLGKSEMIWMQEAGKLKDCIL